MRRRPVLRAAAVGGGAYALGKRNAAAPPVAPAETGGEVTTRLAELGKLHDQGVLTDEEFAAAKAKLLGL
jgi:hypothetical protein